MADNGTIQAVTNPALQNPATSLTSRCQIIASQTSQKNVEHLSFHETSHVDNSPPLTLKDSKHRLNYYEFEYLMLWPNGTAHKKTDREDSARGC
jgi:hypothetical protein